jgi:hypothetical protein
MHHMTRREFLAWIGAAAGAGELSALAAEGELPIPSSSPTTVPGPSASAYRPTAKSRVVEVRSERVLIGPRVHDRLLAEMLNRALTYVTGKEREADAWHALLADQDVIGLKFNSSGATGLAITEPFAQVLVGSLGRSGWGPEKIVLIEAGRSLVGQLRTQPRREGWQAQVTPFGSGVDELATVLDQVTAIVNVPFLKANQVAGMSGCLKNLSHAMVKHPSRFHGNAQPDPTAGVLKAGDRGAPYIGDIIASAPIRSKLRLHLVNALRTVREPMFEPSGPAVEAYGAILAGVDPVAIDMVGLEILNEQLTSRNLKPLAAPDEPLPQFLAAGNAGLGVWQPDHIDHLVIRS